MLDYQGYTEILILMLILMALGFFNISWELRNQRPQEFSVTFVFCGAILLLIGVALAIWHSNNLYYIQKEIRELQEKKLTN